MENSALTGSDSELRGLVFDVQRFSIHDGPGIRTCVFLKGCPMRCGWCSNPESQARRPELMWSRKDKRANVVGEWMTVAEVMATVLRDSDYYEHSGGGMTLSGGEFMLQPEFCSGLVDAAHDAGITVVGETAGLVRPGVFAELADKLDLVLMDLKHHDPAKHFQATRARLPLVLQNAAYLVNSRTPHLFRIPVVPGVNDALDDAMAFARLLDSYGVTEVELVPFHQYGKGKYADLDLEYGFADFPSYPPEKLAPYQECLEESGLNVIVNA
jgi:pyruvate formate lyase activating enzyme